MKFFVLAAAMLVMQATTAVAQQSVTVTVVTAQEAADAMARTGVLRHCGRAGGRYEGIGFGPTREAAIRNCCFWGIRRPVQIAASYSRARRGWFAVVRYE